MRYLHYVISKEGKQIESVYSNNKNPSWTRKLICESNGNSYKIWDKETNKVEPIVD